jgi:hypothetical protein
LRDATGQNAARKPAFRGFDTIEALDLQSTTNERHHVQLVPRELPAHVYRRRSPGAKGREWSKVPLAPDGSA